MKTINKYYTTIKMVMISVVELFDINDKCCWPKEAFVERKQEVGR